MSLWDRGFQLKPSGKTWKLKGVVKTEFHNYPEKKEIREVFVNYTVSGKYTSHREQTVLLIKSLEKYLLSVTKWSKRESFIQIEISQVTEFIVKVTL